MRFKYTPYDNSASTGSIAQLMLQSGQLQSQTLQDLARIAAQQQTGTADIAANTQSQSAARSAALINNLAAAMGGAVNQTAKNVSNNDYDPGGSKFSGPMQPGPYQPGGSQFSGPVWQPSQAPAAAAPQDAHESALQNWLAYFGKG
jgi:hypothetical protein